MENANKEIEYWLFSNAEQPTFARTRNDIPVDIVNDVSDEEAKQICAKIREKLENGQFYEIYVNVLVHLNDLNALDVLRKWERHFKEKQRVGKHAGITCSAEIRLLNNAISHLQHIK